jgi:hypothetical protein
VLGVLAVILLVLGSLGAWAWTRTQYYVGVYQGSVAVFQGIPSGFGPHGWSTVENVSTTQAADLPEYDRAQVEANIPASDVASALAIQMGWPWRRPRARPAHPPSAARRTPGSLRPHDPAPRRRERPKLRIRPSRRPEHEYRDRGWHGD